MEFRLLALVPTLDRLPTGRDFVKQCFKHVFHIASFTLFHIIFDTGLRMFSLIWWVDFFGSFFTRLVLMLLATAPARKGINHRWLSRWIILDNPSHSLRMCSLLCDHHFSRSLYDQWCVVPWWYCGEYAINLIGLRYCLDYPMLAIWFDVLRFFNVQLSWHVMIHWLIKIMNRTIMR